MERQATEIVDIQRRLGEMDKKIENLMDIRLQIAEIKGAVSILKYSVPIIVTIGSLLVGWLEYASRH